MAQHLINNSNKIKLLIFILMLITLSHSVNAYADEKIIHTNTSNLPEFGTVEFEFNLKPNAELYFTLNKSSSFVQLTFPSDIVTDADGKAILNVDYVIPRRTNITGDVNGTSSIVVSNNVSSVVVDVAITAFIDYIKKNNSITRNRSNTIGLVSIDKLEFTKSGANITISRDLLPKEGEITFLINGTKNKKYKVIKCEKYITCPKELYFNNTKKANFTIKYEIPFLNVGTYSTRFLLNTTNGTIKKLLDFNIVPPIFNVEHYTYTDECFKSAQAFASCETERLQFESDRREDFLIYLFSENLTCPDVNTSQELQDMVNILRADLDTSRNQYNNLASSFNEEAKKFNDNSEQLTSCIGNIETIQKNATKSVAFAQSNAEELIQKRLAEIEQQQKDFKDNFWGWILVTTLIIVFIVGASVCCYYIAKHYKWII